MVFGVFAVPALRAFPARGWSIRRFKEATVAILLLATGGGVALGWRWSQSGTIEALTLWNASYRPPEELLWIVVGVGGFHAVSSLDRVLRLSKYLVKPFRGWVSYSAVFLGGVGAWLALSTASNVLIPSLDDWGWKAAIALLGLIGPAVVAVYLLTGSVRPGLGRLSEKIRHGIARSRETPPAAAS
jgi:hypothetical protein